MPRPGPRPYECVRRAWHSDRHQPMRGSVIQEIFKLANELHSPSTQRNREWQEKLPCVVFKVEEIIYSKANSEAEYVDIKTLRDRANDAIDTIIRRDEATEATQQLLLQPCIEAALNLGCIPRRASRSQRHSNQVLYLRSSTQQPPTALPEIPENNEGSPARWLPRPPSHHTNQQGSTSQFTSWHTHSEIPPQPSAALSDVYYGKGDSCYSSKNSLLLRPDGSQPIRHEAYSSSKNPCVYPLYYGYSQHETGSNLALERPHESMNDIPATSTPPVGKFEVGFFRNYFDSSSSMDNINNISNIKGISEYPSSPSCDLSLCLGLPSAPSLTVENTWTGHGFEDVHSASSFDGS